MAPKAQLRKAARRPRPCLHRHQPSHRPQPLSITAPAGAGHSSIRCPAGHYFCGAIESLTWDGKHKHDPGSAARTPPPGAITSKAAITAITVAADPAHRNVPAEPERDARRPNTAPAYYLGHPAALWITAMRPHHRHTASRNPIEAAVSGGNPIPDSGVLRHR